MFCTSCGSEINGDDAFCTKCGNKIELSETGDSFDSNESVETVPVDYNVKPEIAEDYYSNDQQDKEDRPYIEGYIPGMDYTPIGMWGYFGFSILYSIPIIGFILSLLFAFGISKNINVRNYARSYFCIYIIALVIFLIIKLFFEQHSVSSKSIW